MTQIGLWLHKFFCPLPILLMKHRKPAKRPFEICPTSFQTLPLFVLGCVQHAKASTR